MSLSEDRQLIADTMSEVEGVKGFAYRPKTSNAGDSWPILGFQDNAAGNSLQTIWRVIVILPKTEKDAMDWYETKYEQISDALNESVGFVERIEPGSLETELGDRDVMILTVRKEA